MVMPGVGTEPGGPSRACDEVASQCSRSLNESLSAEQERGEDEMRNQWERDEDTNVRRSE